MDAWLDETTLQFPSPLGALGSDFGSPLFAGILDAKRQLESKSSNQQSKDGLEGSQKDLLFLSIITGDMVVTETILTPHPELLDSFYPENSNGYSPLIFAIVFSQHNIAESLLRVHSADPDAPDSTSTKYTPLMWAVLTKDISSVSLLVEFYASPEVSPGNHGISASSLAASTSSADIFEYFKSHNLFKNDDSEDVYPLQTFGDTYDESIDDVAFKISMSTLAANNGMIPSEGEDSEDEESRLASSTLLAQVPEFDYHKPLPDQFIKFTDSDIPSLLDYIFGLRSASFSNQHKTKIPAAILFQLLHYSHNKVNSKDLTEFLFECFITRLRSVTNTKSGVFNMALTTGDQSERKSVGGAGDIVLLSYWLSVIQFLHFYFTKANLYHEYPKFLQELINLTQSLIATLSFAINSRLNLLVDDCMLNFTSLVDVSSVLYAKDWNIFKSQKKHPNSYDAILNMLYPPSLNEMMKPSPLKYVQVLAALYYVLEIHHVDPLLRVQAFSQVFYYINATLFNRLISNSKFCSRIKAVQIRLNISALEDWLRSRNIRAHKPEKIGGLESLVTSAGEFNSFHLTTLLENGIDGNDPNCLSFYYNSLFDIAKTQLLPTIELLQWLQVLTGLQDEEGLIKTINEFDTLNYYQLVKLTAKQYRYEVNEPKVPKPLIQLLKRLVVEQGAAQINRSNLHYMTQSTFLSKEVYIYLNPNYVFGVALPNSSELIMNYGSGIGGVKILRAKHYQPSLPIGIMDDIDSILTQNKNENVNDMYNYDTSGTEEESVDKSPVKSVNVSQKDEKKAFKGDELFKHMEPPSSLAHKDWGVDEIENNPW